MRETQVRDAYDRPLRDLRISVTDRCNFRCVYCMPSEANICFMPREQLLSFEEIVRLAQQFAGLGTEKIRLTGGEPLLRKDLVQLVKMLYEIEGIKDIALTTNGVLLKRYAKDLYQAGVKRVNISLDALDDEVFTVMNGVGARSGQVLAGVDAALEAGMTVKVNMVVKKGMNASQILPMARFFKEKGIMLRYIEYMDVGSSNGWNMEDVVTNKEIRDMIHAEMPMEPADPAYFGEVASRYRYVGTDVEVGFISSVSEAFCSSCTRARLSADGQLYTCLFADKGLPLKPLLRSAASDEEIQGTLRAAWHKRDDRYSEERVSYYESGRQKKRIEMSYIGG
ncbi:GTP 3',8-cyclase MoaA [Ectobacillus ponti]|uniref:GTP 3',8-cyclase n=1 Tax=Ectobacillus ponti TaxID=2961894 RepID=A0AA41X761_9BACI|nr:GTP 3',8-cyclase MoaA [Ectobacillus ponti]MCP8967538.1 GTP 3',8-cyclase MoaA [Ectobacillus ponti]